MNNKFGNFNVIANKILNLSATDKGRISLITRSLDYPEANTLFENRVHSVGELTGCYLSASSFKRVLCEVRLKTATWHAVISEFKTAYRTVMDLLGDFYLDYEEDHCSILAQSINVIMDKVFGAISDDFPYTFVTVLLTHNLLRTICDSDACSTILVGKFMCDMLHYLVFGDECSLNVVTMILEGVLLNA